MKKNRIVFWIATGLLSVMMLMSAGMYVFNNEMAQGMIVSLGFPAYIIYPLAFLKVSGVAVITLTKWDTLKEWAYAGFAFDFLFAAISHWAVDGINGQTFFPLIVFGILAVSYIYYHKNAAKSSSILNH